MRSFVLRVRKGKIRADQLQAKPGAGDHVEIIAHTLVNAFYFSNGMRENVDVYIVLDSTADFPKTLRFSSHHGLSFPGFHEQAILGVVADALQRGNRITKGEKQTLSPGIEIYGFGFDILMKELQVSYPVYLLDKKGEDIRSLAFKEDGVFVLSDHIPMPKNSIKGMERRGLTKMSLGPKMLFASQCVVLVHNELDRQLG